MLTAFIVVVAVLLVFGCAIAFGGPGDPPSLASVNNPFKNLDFSDLPASDHYAARDGSPLTYRAYPAALRTTRGSVVLVHGSSARGSSMHFVARAFAAAGYVVYALDIRGHGESGIKGEIDYVGQLEDDLEDFVHAAVVAQPATLVGFSSGGGFVLRFAGSARQQLFASYVLLSPFMGQSAPTYRPASGGWVRVGLARLFALVLLNAIGVRAFNKLPVIRFALNEQARLLLTSHYSFALAQNFRPDRDYGANIRRVNQALRVVAGADDEVFYADRFSEVFAQAGKQIPVTLIPGIGHIPLTLEQFALQAVVGTVVDMNEQQV